MDPLILAEMDARAFPQRHGDDVDSTLDMLHLDGLEASV